ncbi:hypothetical protein BLAT2472_20244 [Burkholderia latens]
MKHSRFCRTAASLGTGDRRLARGVRENTDKIFFASCAEPQRAVGPGRTWPHAYQI